MFDTYTITLDFSCFARKTASPRSSGGGPSLTPCATDPRWIAQVGFVIRLLHQRKHKTPRVLWGVDLTGIIQIPDMPTGNVDWIGLSRELKWCKDGKRAAIGAFHSDALAVVSGNQQKSNSIAFFSEGIGVAD
ncbi:hypothetical protein K1W69_19390 [Hoeflea sp. WL0058]|uniref:Uncharacterized protein n=1 Tax=Flavimaribacter sediminis TaxID=2865987 RepID=A0AAE3D2P6_9HYPH|nr:hypothetical protein [Flavimaribacter sediminis]MBW8639367.1 hypothetical protein [Flavimaribacter sediminis]